MFRRLLSPLAACSVISLSLWGLPLDAVAESRPGRSFADPPVTLSLFGQVNLGRPGHDLESSLRDAALDDDYCPLENPGTPPRACGPTPVRRDGRLGLGLVVGYSLNPYWEIRALYRAEDDTRAFGVRQVLYRVQLDLDANSKRYAAAIVYRPKGSALRVGVGPAFHDSEVRGRDDWSQFPAEVKTTVGFVVDAGVSFPHRSRTFLDVGMQYWHGGEMSYGPYQIRNGIGNVQVYYPRSPYSLNRTSIAVGFGVRL